jgi:hypothetical protein
MLDLYQCVFYTVYNKPKEMKENENNQVLQSRV